MSPLDAAILRRKMQVIVQNLRQLEEVRSAGIVRYQESMIQRKGTERLLQELIEAAIDINFHILAASSRGVPEQSYESFIELGALGVLTPELAAGTAPSAGLRNRLVHEYEDIDDQKVWEAIGYVQELFPRYLKQVEDFVEKEVREGG